MSRSPAHDLSEALGRLLLRQTRVRLYEELVDGVDGVELATYPVLSGLARLGERTASQLAVEVGLDRSVTSRYITVLEQAGLIERHGSAHDHRAVAVRLTRDGRHAVALTRRRLEQRLAVFLARYPPDQQRLLADMLVDLTGHLQHDGQPESRRGR